jgi:phosphoribosylformimino-5-aminoimidazole carboxamide ribotide isomerase
VKIIPAIDLQDGKCVRLYQGDFDKRTEYGSDPAAVAQNFRAAGFKNLHIVDLDGARHGRQDNRNIVSTITSETDLVVQLGGGIRSQEAISKWLAAGVSRCVIGSLAIDEPELIKSCIEEFTSDRIVLALDVKFNDDSRPMLVSHGWKRTTDIDLWNCVDDYLQYGLRHVLCTDVSRDGAMTGPNIALYSDFVRRYPTIELQASGGVRHADDLRMLAGLGAAAAISGRALLEGRIKTRELEQFLLVA